MFRLVSFSSILQFGRSNTFLQTFLVFVKHPSQIKFLILTHSSKRSFDKLQYSIQLPTSYDICEQWNYACHQNLHVFLAAKMYPSCTFCSESRLFSDHYQFLHKNRFWLFHEIISNTQQKNWSSHILWMQVGYSTSTSKCNLFQYCRQLLLNI